MHWCRTVSPSLSSSKKHNYTQSDLWSKLKPFRFSHLKWIVSNCVMRSDIKCIFSHDIRSTLWSSEQIMLLDLLPVNKYTNYKTHMKIAKENTEYDYITSTHTTATHIHFLPSFWKPILKWPKKGKPKYTKQTFSKQTSKPNEIQY